jgi:hypothetical protein
MPEADRRSQLTLLLQRLERISADSRWAHLASGYRGSLLKALEQLERDGSLDADWQRRLSGLIDGGTTILNQAARERIGRRSTRWK